MIEIVSGILSGVIFWGMVVVAIYIQILIVLALTSFMGGTGITKVIHKIHNISTDCAQKETNKQESNDKISRQLDFEMPKRITNPQNCQYNENCPYAKHCNQDYSEYLLGILLKPISRFIDKIGDGYNRCYQYSVKSKSFIIHLLAHKRSINEPPTKSKQYHRKRNVFKD